MARREDRRPQPKSPPRLHHRRDVRGRHRPDRDRDQVDPRRQGQPVRRVRAHRARRGVADRRPHRAVRGRQPLQPRAQADPQAAAPPLRDRRAAGPGQGQGPDDRPAPAVHQRARPGQGRARPRARQAAPRPPPRHRRPRRPSATSLASWPTRSAAGRRRGRARPIPRAAADRSGHRGRGRPRGGRAGPGHRRRRRGRAGRDDVREDDLAPGQPRRPAPADAPRAARLPGRELQPRPAVIEPGGGRRVRDHGAGRVPGDVGHEHDLRGDRPARDRACCR